MAGAPSRLLFQLTNPISLIHRLPFSLFRLARRHSLTTLSATTNHQLLRHTSFSPIKFSQNFHSKATTFVLPKNYHNLADGYHVHQSHPWPEWVRLLESLSHAGYFNGNCNIEDEFIANENLPMKFVKDANSCLAFARDRPDILGLLPRKDIEVVIDNGYPFLFQSGQETKTRMRSFLQEVGFNEATLVDLMKYILSYASNSLPIIYPERNINEATETSVRNLLQEMANVSYRGREQMPRNLGPNITMKKGDWICPKCSFMNFARNTQCLECEELRPQRQLTGGEWDCPRCNFFNYRKNVVCLKCECRRPDEGPLHRDYGPSGGYASSTSEISNTYIQSSRIQDTEKEERTERWFKKVKELHGVTSPETSISNDDFPQIMPMRKEKSHFVDNKTKDRSFSPYQGSTSSFVPFPPDYFAKKDVQQQPESTDSTVKPTSGNFYSNKYNATLDMNFVQGTRNQQMSNTNNRTLFSGETNTHSSSNQFRRNEPYPEGNRTMFSGDMNTVSSNDPFRRNEAKPEGNRTIFSGDMNTDSSRNQFRRNGPMPEGNRTMSSGDMNTISSNNPFRRNEPKPEGNRTIFRGDMKTNSSRNQFRRNEPMPEGNRTLFSGDMNTDSSSNQFRRNEPMPEGNRTLFNEEMKTDSSSNQFRRNEPMPEGNRTLFNGEMKTDSSSNQFRRNEPRTEIRQQTPESMNVGNGWTGKSLEGSAVTEPDPLDMSEEAKAERWFRRVAQIKDISELSQIPDEDFPSIMPMRKGVNRFVVSKRKTPLERRLTSPQYRKNLRIMSSDPMKNDGNNDN